MTARMPARGDRSAPTFDHTKPRELKRFFVDIEYLFKAIPAMPEEEKKEHATRYVSIEVADIWETLPEYSDITKSFDDFKKAIQSLYPASDEDYKYTLADMDILIGNRQRLGVHSLADLADYHAQFLAITQFLITKKRLSEIEQKHAYVRGFPPSIWSKVSQRLQLKFLDHLPDEPYPIQDVQAAARFVLHGTHSTALIAPVASPAAPAPSASDGVVKTEQLGSIFTEFTKSIIEALNNTQNRPRANASMTDSGPREIKCNFCGKDHFIRNCELVEEYRRAGKLKRNVEGKVVLPTGAFVPRDTPGNLLKERIDEWHRRNPGQLATATISSATMILAETTTTPAAVAPAQTAHTTYQFSSEDRIALLEAELFNLRAKRPGFTPQIRTRAQKARAANVEDDNSTAQPSAPPRQNTPPVTQETTAPAQPRLNGPNNSNNSFIPPVIDNEPEHPFRNVPDATYMPPQHRNVAALPKPAQKRPEPAYRNSAPIHDAETAESIYNRSLEVPVTLTQRELLSIAPDVRAQYREATTAKRNVNSDRLPQNNILQEDRTQERAI